MKIGKIISINYSYIKVKISPDIIGNSVNVYGNIYYFGNIGSYLKITSAAGEIILCEVVSIFDSDLHQDKLSFGIESSRELLIKAIGTISKDNRFELSVGVIDGLYADVSIVNFNDIRLIVEKNTNDLGQVDEKQIYNSFSLGASKDIINYPIDVSIDSFFDINSAALGNSGRDKSNIISYIIQEIYKKEKHSATGSRILIFDVNGEYKKAFTNDNNTDILIKYYKLNINNIKVSDHPMLTLLENFKKSYYCLILCN
ncbi:uncharacterized protein BPLS_P5746 [Bathymodiolus platifrons methanotrophic gill symbiont]|uniref:helicase HerA domain-containing protein n=1 Tax=Bathymodiolus platifrons methanotrophic gill symbiont TaxID=113268 RepID=UPI001B5DB919|nr:DUF87 domain-containing protein [Bathymodiolus platifrons methanotrophic gill symbiont]GFO77356.1 uncharacterized protein BPLS_P5746 [Bathymodiolus platifrons methanotrophic gill symbiont]